MRSEKEHSHITMKRAGKIKILSFSEVKTKHEKLFIDH
jgi:hypothetical protein